VDGCFSFPESAEREAFGGENSDETALDDVAVGSSLPVYVELH
jgi:hypothetical protein